MADTRHFPHPEYPFFLYDPCGDGFVFYRTEAERDAAVPDVIDAYLDDGLWMEEVEQVACGVMTHAAAQVDRVERPADDEKADEQGWPHECDYRCTYRAVPLTELNTQRTAVNERVNGPSTPENNPNHHQRSATINDPANPGIVKGNDGPQF